jgi:signal transduction histidine kinase
MARLLLVDDLEENLTVLHRFLSDSGHELIDARTGEEALRLAWERRVDLVLCDVIMPELNGFEIARRLKEAHRDEYLPVVLITSLTDQSSRQLGLRVGADDFLSRPVDRAELHSRITTLLALREQRRTLSNKIVELAEMHRFRDEVSAMIVHALKNPLSVVVGGLDYLADEKFSEGGAEAFADTRAAARRIAVLLDNLLDVTRLEANRFPLKRRRITLEALMGPLLAPRRRMFDAREIRLEVVYDPSAMLDIDADLVARVVENLLDNGMRYAPAGGVLRVTARTEPGQQAIVIGNSGPPVPAESRAIIFEKYGQASGSNGRMNLGIGLYFCRLVAEAHGGRIHVEETAELPAMFVVTLPW